MKNPDKDIDDVLTTTCVGIDLVDGRFWCPPVPRIWSLLDAVCDLLAGTAWGGDNETVFQGRKTLYAELRVPEPKSMAGGARKVTA